MGLPMKYFLVTDPFGTCAERLEKQTGLRCYDTQLGILVEKPEPFNLEREMEKFNRILNPRCPDCGPFFLCSKHMVA